MSHNPTLSPESVGGGVRGAMPLEYLEEDYEAGVDALPQQLRFEFNHSLVSHSWQNLRYAKRGTGFQQ